MSLSTDIAKFTDLVQSWASKVSDVFYSDVAADVTIKVIDGAGDVVDVVIPNHKKMQDTYDTWRTTLNIKNLAGVITDDAGAALSVDKFGGLTLAEYAETYKNYFDAKKIKIMPRADKGNSTRHAIIVVTEDNRVIGWGNNYYLSYGGLGITPSFVELQQAPEKVGVNIIEAYSTGMHYAILYEDGDLYVRGKQDLGHFGIGNTTAQNTFVLSAIDVVDYVTSSTGDQEESPMAMIIKEDGSVFTSGDNGHGELGIGSATNNYSWSRVYYPPEFGGDKAVQTYVNGDDVAHSAIVTEAGKLYVSGYNGYGQLGLGDTASRNVFTEVTNTFDGTGVAKFTACGYYDATYTGTTTILTKGGRVFSCGYNGQGQIGNGNTTQQNSFVESSYAVSHDVATEPVVDIISGHRTTGYLTSVGDLYMVGGNNYGQLGNGTITNNSAYQLALTNVKNAWHFVASDASQYDSLYATTVDDKFYSWGNNVNGSLAQYHYTNLYVATQVRFDRAAEIVDLSFQGYSDQTGFFALMSNGDMYAAGENYYGLVTGGGGINGDNGNRAEMTKLNF